MSVRFLELGDRAARKAKKVVNHAKKKANWYNPKAPGWMSKIPGHDRRHICKLNDFRCVFSYTIDQDNNLVVRHLTISVPGKNYPNPHAVIAIARLFGFTGKPPEGEMFPPDWAVGPKQDGPIDDHCIVAGQVIAGLRP